MMKQSMRLEEHINRVTSRKTVITFLYARNMGTIYEKLHVCSVLILYAKRISSS